MRRFKILRQFYIRSSKEGYSWKKKKERNKLVETFAEIIKCMYYCRRRKREHLSSLLNEVQQLITYKFFSVFEHLVFHLHLVHMTAARSRRAPGRAGFPQAFSDKEDALSQLTEGKGRGKRKRFLRPLPPPPGRGPVHPNGVFTLQKIKSFRDQ